MIDEDDWRTLMDYSVKSDTWEYWDRDGLPPAAQHGGSVTTQSAPKMKRQLTEWWMSDHILWQVKYEEDKGIHFLRFMFLLKVKGCCDCETSRRRIKNTQIKTTLNRILYHYMFSFVSKDETLQWKGFCFDCCCTSVSRTPLNFSGLCSTVLVKWSKLYHANIQHTYY